MRKVATLTAVLAGILLLGHGQPAGAQNKKDYYKDVRDALDYFRSSRSTDKAFALATLGLVGLEARKSNNPQLQRFLEQQGTKITVQGLVLDDQAIRQAANNAMANVNPTIGPPVLALVNGKSYEQRLEGMRKLASLGTAADSTVPALLSFMKQARTEDKASVVQAIATVGAKDAQVGELIAMMALKDPDPTVKTAALNTLAKLPPGPATDVFLQTLNTSTDPNLRLSAVRGLSQIARNNPAALQQLEKLATMDANPLVKQEAQQALQKATKQQ
jgi:hypothetical protein